ncbi:hypothetical protein EGW08_012307 [Elysia chlorotica]|uniref:Peptidase M12B domain-containing protein n=1 Tax=Elysia chlorotica TaxID=188477 RepID=A0A433TED9_ELYCH|nr:hypothetical protein EGW08_012307 [Elysia chlorotica]
MVNQHIVDVALLSEKSSGNVRIQRDLSSNLPELLNFHIPTTKANVTLQLRQSSLLPVVTDHLEPNTPFIEDAAVYTDVANGASFIVRKDGNQYTLQGTFFQAHEEWNLEPVDRALREADGANPHKLQSADLDAGVISLVGDAIESDLPHVEVLTVEERTRFYLQNLAGKGENVNKTKIKDHGERRQINGKSKRAPVSHMVEMAFIVDYADYQRWVSYSSSPVSAATLWYTYIAEAVNIRYRTIIDSSIRIGTKVKYLRIFTQSSEDFMRSLTFFGSFDGVQGIRAFRSWVSSSGNRVPNSDHYMYFTGYDIRGSTIGIAYVSTACTSSGVSLTENSFNAGVGYVAAHELGHSLSMRHDRDMPGCTDDTYNVMSAIYRLPISTTYRGNGWKFSSCSKASMKSYLSRVSCTQPGNTGSYDRLPAPTGNNRGGLKALKIQEADLATCAVGCCAVFPLESQNLINPPKNPPKLLLMLAESQTADSGWYDCANKLKRVSHVSPSPATSPVQPVQPSPATAPVQPHPQSSHVPSPATAPVQPQSSHSHSPPISSPLNIVEALDINLADKLTRLPMSSSQ